MSNFKFKTLAHAEQQTNLAELIQQKQQSNTARKIPPPDVLAISDSVAAAELRQSSPRLLWKKPTSPQLQAAGLSSPQTNATQPLPKFYYSAPQDRYPTVPSQAPDRDSERSQSPELVFRQAQQQEQPGVKPIQLQSLVSSDSASKQSTDLPLKGLSHPKQTNSQAFDRENEQQPQLTFTASKSTTLTEHNSPATTSIFRKRISEQDYTRRELSQSRSEAFSEPPNTLASPELARTQLVKLAPTDQKPEIGPSRGIPEERFQQQVISSQRIAPLSSAPNLVETPQPLQPEPANISLGKPPPPREKPRTFSLRFALTSFVFIAISFAAGAFVAQRTLSPQTAKLEMLEQLSQDSAAQLGKLNSLLVGIQSRLVEAESAVGILRENSNKEQDQLRILSDKVQTLAIKVEQLEKKLNDSSTSGATSSEISEIKTEVAQLTTTINTQNNRTASELATLNRRITAIERFLTRMSQPNAPVEIPRR